jgi:acetaldehyde dehydrogenase (acetylating)
MYRLIMLLVVVALFVVFNDDSHVDFNYEGGDAVMGKLLLNPLTQAIVDAQNAEKLRNSPPIDVMACGGCGAIAFYVFATGQVACASCNELVAGVTAKPSVEGEQHGN